MNYITVSSIVNLSMMALSCNLRCFGKIFEPYYLLMFRSCSMSNTNSTDKSYMKTPPWDRLPDDVLEVIFGKLGIGDRVRLRLVCKLWNRILIQPHIPTAIEAPWEILSNDSYKNPETYLTELCFKSWSEDRTYRFKLPMLNGQLDNRGWLCAHSRGWLVMAVGPNLNPDIFLWNPLSGATRKLPPLSTLPFFEDFQVYDDLGTTIQNFSSVIDSVEIFSVGTVDCVVAALFRTSKGKRMALCTPRELEWIPFNAEQEEGIPFADILFHTLERKLTVLYLHTSSTSILAEKLISNNFEVRLMDCQVAVSIFVRKYVDPQDELLLPGLQMLEPRRIFRLVESSITHRVLLSAMLIERFVSRDESPFPKIKCEQTVTLGVYDLIDLCGPDQVREEVVCEKEAIFLGATGSFAFPVTHGIVSKCIYFAVDEANVIVGEGDDRKPYVVRESGHCILAPEKCMRRNSYKKIRSPSESKTGWFMPQLFMF